GAAAPDAVGARDPHAGRNDIPPACRHAGVRPRRDLQLHPRLGPFTWWSAGLSPSRFARDGRDRGPRPLQLLLHLPHHRRDPSGDADPTGVRGPLALLGHRVHARSLKVSARLSRDAVAQPTSRPRGAAAQPAFAAPGRHSMSAAKATPKIAYPIPTGHRGASPSWTLSSFTAPIPPAPKCRRFPTMSGRP